MQRQQLQNEWMNERRKSNKQANTKQTINQPWTTMTMTTTKFIRTYDTYVQFSWKFEKEKNEAENQSSNNNNNNINKNKQTNKQTTLSFPTLKPLGPFLIWIFILSFFRAFIDTDRDRPPLWINQSVYIYIEKIRV